MIFYETQYHIILLTLGSSYLQCRNSLDLWGYHLCHSWLWHAVHHIPCHQLGAISFPDLIKFLSLLLPWLIFINFRAATNQESLEHSHIFFTLLPESPKSPKSFPKLLLLLLPIDWDAPRIDNQGYLQQVPTQNNLKTTQNYLDNVLTYKLSLSCYCKYFRIPLFLSMFRFIHVDPLLLHKLALFCSN